MKNYIQIVLHFMQYIIYIPQQYFLYQKTSGALNPCLLQIQQLNIQTVINNKKLHYIITLKQYLKKMINKHQNITKNKQIDSKIQEKMFKFMQNKLSASKKQQILLNKKQQQQAQQLFDQISLSQQNQVKKQQEEQDEEVESQEQDDNQQGQQQNMEDNSSQSAKDKNTLDKKIVSILKSGLVSKMVAQKKKQVTFKLDNIKKQQDKYIVLGSNRKWNERLQNPRKGKFEPQQKRMLIQSLSQSLSQANLSLEEVVKTVSEDDQKIPRNLHFWTKVCSVLPDRTLTSSYKFLKRQLSSKNKGGDWTEDETILLEQLVKKYGRKWAMIAKQMNRTSQNIRDKYRSLGEQRINLSIQQTIWKFKQLKQFLNLVQKYSKIRFLDQGIQKQLQNAQKHDEIQLKQMKQRRYNSKSFNFHNNQIVRKYIKRQFNDIKTQAINWQQISNKLQTKTVYDCRNKFVQLLQLQFNGMGSKQYYQSQISKFIWSQKPKNQVDINWQKWNNKQVSCQQAKNRWMILKRHIQGRGQKSFQQLTTLVYQKYHLKKN